jgi:hypothetical protein
MRNGGGAANIHPIAVLNDQAGIFDLKRRAEVGAENSCASVFSRAAQTVAKNMPDTRHRSRMGSALTVDQVITEAREALSMHIGWRPTKEFACRLLLTRSS